MKAIFTKRNHIGSLAIRIANPVSFIMIAPASHVILLDGNTGYGIEANASHGVRRAPLNDLLHGLIVVKEVAYEVPSPEIGLAWARRSVGSKYDFKGALALGLAPDRDWQDESDWFCFEHFCNCMAKAGRKPFANHAHITAYMLLSLTPSMNQS